MSDRDRFSEQVDKLTSSGVLHGSESLCKLLRYLAQHAIEHPGVSPKEYQIATEVFGRPSTFDPQMDSTIRVQAGRLRSKLAEYYASEGRDDSTLVELPKGSYQLTFQPRRAETENDKPGAKVRRLELLPPVSRESGRGWPVALLVVSILLAAALVTIALLLTTDRPAMTALAGTTEPASASLQTFWKPFVTGPDEPWLIFSNAAFVGRSDTGMRYYRPATDSKETILDHYTGVGEVLGVHNLDVLFGAMHRTIRVKRGSLFSLDDLKNNDLIFLGSPAENLTLLEIPGSQEFSFQQVTEGPRKGDLSIVNVHPQSGEPRNFLASPSTSSLTEDYSVVALMPGPNPARALMILAGTTTFGTQGAVEFVSRANSVANLLAQLRVANNGEIKPFEALLRVKIARGVPVETELVAVRNRAR
jgi:hypothetical protein